MDDQGWFVLAKDPDEKDEELLDTLLSEQEETSIEIEVAIANDQALHPYHQKVLDRPQDYVTIHRDQWNRVLELAGQTYEERWKNKVKQAAMGDKSYLCRYDCGQSFTNSSNRNRHEKNVHGKGEQS